MAKLEWGKKRICPSCGLKYYDFNKSPITCPTCNVEFDPDLYLKSRKGKSMSSKLGAENKVDTSDVEDIEVETAEEAIDEELIVEIKFQMLKQKQASRMIYHLLMKMILMVKML